MDSSGDELAKRFRGGDVTAFEALMTHYEERIYRTAYRVLGRYDLAMDVVQDTFVTVYRDIVKWNERSAFYTWVYRVAVNKAVDRIRRGKRHAEAVSHLAREKSVAADNVAEVAVLEEKEYLLEKVGRAMEQLPEAQRTTMVLRHHEGLSLKEIALVRGCSLGTVKSTLFQAFQHLLEILGVESHDAGGTGVSEHGG